MYALDKDTLNAVVTYLADCPWREVKDLIAAVLKAKPVNIQEPPKADS